MDMLPYTTSAVDISAEFGIDLRSRRKRAANQVEHLSTRIHEVLNALLSLNPGEDIAFDLQAAVMRLLSDIIESGPGAVGKGAVFRFAAAGVNSLLEKLPTLSFETQGGALMVSFAILGALGLDNRYLRAAMDSDLGINIPNIAAKFFVEGSLTWDADTCRPMRAVLSHFLKFALIWGHASHGNDGKASIDKEWRARSIVILEALISEQLSCVEHQRFYNLRSLFRLIDTEDGDSFVAALRSHAENIHGSLFKCAAKMCGTSKEYEDLLRCSVCKVVVYCGEICQEKDWKAFHQYVCFNHEIHHSE